MEGSFGFRVIVDRRSGFDVEFVSMLVSGSMSMSMSGSVLISGVDGTTERVLDNILV